ncbi:MAG: tetratricopeptide repeat protein [Nitrospirota bacterium]
MCTPRPFAQTPPSVPFATYDLSLTKGLALLNQKNYQDAIVELRRALAVKPHDVPATYHLGVALRKDGQFREAEAALEEVVRLDPAFQRVHFELGAVKYELGDYKAALREMDLAEQADPDSALTYYYQGLALHRLGEYERSSPRFLRAIGLAPELGLTAHYYAGLGYYRLNILDEARDAFEEVIRIDPHSPIAESARDLLAQIERRTPAKRWWNLLASAAYQYDTNVILLPGGSALPAGISRESDSRAVFYGRGEIRSPERRHLRAGAAYTVYQSLHAELTEFNVQSHQGEVYASYRRKPITVRVPYQVSYSLVDGEEFLLTHSARPTLSLTESRFTATQVEYGFSVKDFRESTRFVGNDDRDAVNHAAGIAQTLILGKGNLIRAGYRYDTELTGDSPTEDDWEYTGHRIYGNVRLPVYFAIDLEVGADYYRQQYEHPNSLSALGINRDDRLQAYNASLSRTFLDWLTVTIEYLYTNNDSNLPEFTYDRGVSSVILAGRW